MKLGAYVIMLLTMMIVLEFVGVPTGLSTTLESFGITINQNTSELINADIESSSIWANLFLEGSGILIVVLAGTAVIGLFARGYDTSLVVLPFVITIATLFGGTFWAVIKYTQSFNETWMTATIATLFVAIGAGFIWSCIDYFAGR
jgi:hypothetical protein